MTFHRLLLVFCFLGAGCSAIAQFEKDAGAWLGISASYPISKKLDLSVAPECRLDDNMRRIRGLFSDVGAKYKVNDFISVNVEYRGGIRRSNEFYMYRQRTSVGLMLKYEWNDLTFFSTTRNQWTPAAADGDGDIDLGTTFRQKVGVKYKGLKKIELAYSFEWFFEPVAFKPVYSDWRTQLNVEYKLSKRKYFSLGYLVQQNAQNGDMDFVLQASYQVELKRSKKKEKEDQEHSLLP
jgi:hypothetical protein